MDDIRKKFDLDTTESYEEYKGYYLVVCAKHRYGNVLDANGYRRGWVGSKEIDLNNAFSQLKEIVNHPEFSPVRFHQELLANGELTWDGKDSR